MTSEAATVEPLDVIEDLAIRRRTNLKVDPGRPVPDALLERLIAIAATAPNHKRTFPWRFRIVTGEGRARLGAALAADLEAGGEPEYKAVKAKGKYLRAPVVLAVASRTADNEELTKENRDATCAAIQNLLLAATAAGLASYWSTGAAMHSDRLRSVCELDESDTLVGLIYIGWPVGEAPPIDRPAPEVLRIN